MARPLHWIRSFLSAPLLVATLAAVPLPTAVSPAMAGGGDNCVGPASATRIHIKVSNIRSNQGQIAVTLYADDASRFLAKGQSLYIGRVPAAAPSMSVCLYVPQPGTYAIAVYHDEDGNMKLNRNPLGLPLEGYGFSNNAPAAFGLPSFEAVRLKVARTDMETAVTLHYP